MNKFADTLKKLRLEREVSQEELAKAIGLTRAAISKYENKKTDATLEQAKKIADFFGVSVQYLISPEETRKINYSMYNEAIKLAVEHNISPQKLIELIEFYHKFGGK